MDLILIARNPSCHGDKKNSTVMLSPPVNPSKKRKLAAKTEAAVKHANGGFEQRLVEVKETAFEPAAGGTLEWMSQLNEFWRFNQPVKFIKESTTQTTEVAVKLEHSFYDDFAYCIPVEIIDQKIAPATEVLLSLQRSPITPILERKDIPLESRDAFVELMQKKTFLELLSGMDLVDSESEILRLLSGRYNEDLNSEIGDKSRALFHFELVFEACSKYLNIDFCEMNFLNSDLVRRTVCLHIVRHLKASKNQNKFLSANEKETNFKKSQSSDQGNVLREPTSNTKANEEENIIHSTDGWTRPRILICVPTRFFAKEWIEGFLKLLPAKKVRNEEKYVEELFSFDEEGAPDAAQELGVSMLDKTKKPLDFVESFRGNNEDADCVIGVRVENRNVTIYEKSLYQSDIIICTVLGLRTLIGSASEKEDFDFLSSVEVAVFDKTENVLMQNPEHLQRIFQALNQQPRARHKSADIRRLRLCHYQTNTDLLKFLRQTICLSNGRNVDIQHMLGAFSPNLRGCVRFWKKSSTQVAKRANQILKGHLYFLGTPSDTQSLDLTAIHSRLFDTFQKHFIASFHQRFQNDPFLVVVPSYLELLE
eukprot:Gregarina_sp_Poly_1__5964@NODE_313_length_9615_cov_112_161500_g268_i0_p1_GENE_NODE_313_length_9615_cov_112_161500_g268_i0NODE_313_length_9615_cov_112_161500_g268_i0_p1_ORF_typecomplete_len594_score115_90UTP25/PF06862_12/2_4e67DEAD/PF00270_29/0_0037_NODE_313_length_9615_cov_112_161500_g268_i064878268